MEYRSVADLNQRISAECYRVPQDVDLLVGIPRSGMLAANLLALHLNLPVTTLNGFIENRSIDWGMYRSPTSTHTVDAKSSRKALIVDDSIVSGRQMGIARRRLESAGSIDRVLFGVIYSTKERAVDLDLTFEICPTPRVFEWNLMHSRGLAKYCVDIDGVLCVDPSRLENDDGERYRNFITNAQPYLRPSSPIGILVTSRLEKYRTLTEKWLADHNIQYGELKMMHYATMQERKAAGKYAEHKSEVYAASDKRLFIESDAKLASRIAAIAGKPVLAVDTQEMFDPSGLPYLREQSKQLARGVAKEVSNLPHRAIRKLLRIPSRLRYMMRGA